MKRQSSNRNGAAEKFVGKALQLGALKAKLISPPTVVTGAWVGWKCRYGCGSYGSSLVCPPYTPTPEETRRTLDEYSTAVLFEAPDGQAKEIAVKLEREVFLANYYKALNDKYNCR